MNKSEKEYNERRENIKHISSGWLNDVVAWCKEKRFPEKSYKHMVDELEERGDYIES